MVQPTDDELEAHVTKHDLTQYNNLKRISVIANVITSSLAIAAIVLSIHLLQVNEQLQNTRECTRRIDLYASDLRDDINVKGWDSLVTRAEGDNNQDVREIARTMRLKITQLNDSRDMRNKAIQICDANPDFEPPRSR
jgi:hypothetical protein